MYRIRVHIAPAGCKHGTVIAGTYGTTTPLEQVLAHVVHVLCVQMMALLYKHAMHTCINTPRAVN